MIRRIVLCLLMVCVLQTQAMAAVQPVIVQVKYGTNILNLLSALGGGLVLDRIPNTNIYLLGLVKLPLLTALNPLLSLLGLQFMEYDKLVAGPAQGKIGVLTVGNTMPADWYVAQPSFQLLRAGAAHTYSRGRGIVIADLNSKIDYAHPALAGHLTGGYDFVSAKAGYVGNLDTSSTSFLDQSAATFLDTSSTAFLDTSSTAFLDQSAATFLDQSAATFLDAGNPAKGHGTLTAGVIAAVAPESMIMPLRVFDDQGKANVFSIAKATYHAVDNGARVINMSFGMTGNYKSVQAALSYAQSRGVQVVASAGNKNVTTPQFPASNSGVIAVAATDIADKKTSFSNYGTWIYVDAPGNNIISPFPGGYYAIVSGTSFAAPIVAGEAALIMSVKNTNAKTVIGSAVVNINTQNPAYVGKLGKGRVDLLNAVKP
jgi:subtilisin family serine protease